MIKHVIFDIDGTLLDTETAVLSSLQKTMHEQFNFYKELDYYHFTLGIPGTDALKQLNVPEDRYQEILALWDDNFKGYLNTVSVFPEIENCLNELEKLNLKVGIITSKTDEELAHDTHYFPVLSHFNPIITANHTTWHKPNSEPMNLYLRQMHLQPLEALYVGDTIYDYQCATGAKVPFALACWGAKSQEGMENHLILKSPLDLILWLKTQPK